MYRSKRIVTTTLFVIVLSALTVNSQAQQLTDTIAPEIGHAKTDKNAQFAKMHMVVSANPLASQAGYEVLENGGNAIDAMVAVQTVLGLVEPQSSGLGGGAFLVYYDAKSGKIRTFDGRETAPKKVPNGLFLKPNMTPMAFFDAVVGGRSVGTPGTVKLLWETHQSLGSVSWKALFKPAISLAKSGFKVSPRLSNAVDRDQKYLSNDQTAFQYFFPGGQAISAGSILKNKAYANTLTKIAYKGGDYFYSDEYAKSIVDKVQMANNKGYLSLQDFRDYKVIERQPVCSDYREFEICGMGPPSSGAIAVSQTLGILENFDIRSMKPESPAAWQLISEASRLAFADRGAYVADPDFIYIPEGLLDERYLSTRASLIKPNKAMQSVSAGKPGSGFAASQSPEQASTTHFVIVDSEGNIVSMTSTIENGFGSRLMVNGFLLNNELTDFSFESVREETLIANRVQPGKRPRSSMAPTIVLKDKKPHIALGSPGGSRIIPYVTNALIRMLDWDVSIQDAFNRPHVVNRFGQMDLEENTPSEAFKADFEQMGYKVNLRNLNSGLHGVLFANNGMIGAADPRREGLAVGR